MIFICCILRNGDKSIIIHIKYQFFVDLSLNPPHPDPLITSYALFLKKRYTSISHNHTSQHWTHLPRCEFIQLAMIKEEEVRRGGPEEEIVRLAQQGKIETIIGRKESINLHNLFLPPQPLVVLPPPQPDRVFVIEGAPGGGKSTLALHICHQWAQDAPWLARFDVVVLAYLRDEAIQNASTLADILPARNPEISQSAAARLQDTDGENVLIVLDGWDEFPSNLMSNSLVSTIIHEPHKLSLHRSTVLITSRPIASGNLLTITDRRVEILGFTQHQIREYIEKALDGNSTHIQTLVQHLEENPVIEGYCYIPLHSAILVHIFMTMKGALPTTLHELFCDFVLCCVVREYATHEPDSSLPELSSLDELPYDIKSKLDNLSILAYNGVMRDKVVFYSKDLRKSNLPSDLSSLGLLQAVEGLTLTSKTHSYNFLHLSVQELLAAYRITKMAPGEQVKQFKELFRSHRFQAVLHYYCGFTKLDNLEIQQFISRQHRNSRLHQLLPLLHCFFEAQQPSLCQLVDLQFTTNIELKSTIISNPSDYLAIGYFITSLLSTSTADMSPVRLTIDCKHTDYHCLKLLLSELSKYHVGEQPTACAKSRKLVLLLGTGKFPMIAASEDDDDYDFEEPTSITAQGTKLIATHLKLSPAISEFELYQGDIQWDEDGLFYIAEALQTNSSLTKLSLVNVNMEHTKQNGSALLKMLQVNKSLEYLNFSDNQYAHCCIFEGLRYNTTLTHLILCKTYVAVDDPDTARSLTIMLQENKSLTHLDFSENRTFSQRGACCIFNGLQHNTALTHLFLSNNHLFQKDIDPDTVRSLNLMLQINKSLNHLDLSKSTQLSESEACCIFEGLQHNTNLFNLNLSSTGITATELDTAMFLTKMFQVNKSLTHLDLSSNETFSDSGARCIFQGLQHNTSLVNLNLSRTGITATDPDTARSLTKMLQVNKSLTYLDLSSNETFSDLGVQCIFKGLELNATLFTLNLRKTGITTTDPDTARSLTKMINENKSLTHLDLSRNDEFEATQLDLETSPTITDMDYGCEYFSQAIVCNRSAQTLNIYFFESSDKGIRLILDSLKFKTTIQLMYLNRFYGIRKIVK